MATSIIPDPRPPFLARTYTCSTGTIYPVTDPDHSSRKAISKASLGIQNIPGYVMAGLKSYQCYNNWITVYKAQPNISSGDVLYLMNYTSWEISTTAQVTIIWIRADMIKAG